MHIDPGEFDTEARIERPARSASFKGAGAGGWEKVDDVWVGIRDMLPSRGERLADGINVETRPARLRMRFHEEVTSSMRFVIEGRGALEIVAGPAVLGKRQWMEFMVAEYRPAGGGS